jgi:molybdopterin-containing oxidoreductase family membrane subunit
VDHNVANKDESLSPDPGNEGALLLAPGHTFATVTDKISAIVLTRRPPRGWWIGFFLAFALVMVMIYSIIYLLAVGVGIWGVNIPVGWGFAIINMVWWIGIGHAGTLISAILLLLNQPWRTSINRFAEAMTLFAVACAVLFPLLHIGRPWVFYWMIPYQNTMDVWPQFRSPLMWDVFAISTYGLVSLMFWFVGLIPDLATLRDRSHSRVGRIVYGFLAMGWRGSAIHWHRYHTAYFLLAGLATPLVVSVHTVVSLDFATSVIPGWHATIFPPYFVAGAIYSGFAMVLTLAIPLRAVYGLRDFITDSHLDKMAKVMLATGLMVAYGYGMEVFFGWYSANNYEEYMINNRMTGPYAPSYWALKRDRSAVALVEAHPPQPGVALCRRHHRQHRHVARAVCDRCYQPSSRFLALVVGHVLSDDLGLGALCWHARFFLRAIVHLYSFPSDDFDLRDAGAGRAGRGTEGGIKQSVNRLVPRLCLGMGRSPGSAWLA